MLPQPSKSKISTQHSATDQRTSAFISSAVLGKWGRYITKLFCDRAVVDLFYIMSMLPNSLIFYIISCNLFSSK